MNSITTPGVYDGIPDADYHADPVPGGSLSSTGARALLRSPAHYAWQQEHRAERAVFDVGHAVHAVVLGVGMGIERLEFDSFRSAAARDARDAARNDGKVPILEADWAPIAAMCDAVLAHPVARGLLEQPGKAEQSVFAADPDTGVWLRGRVDFLPDDLADRPTVLVDLKTAVTADPGAFGRSAAEYGYDIQSQWYQHVLRLARGDTDTEFVFIVVEKQPPHPVCVIELDAEFAAIGRVRMRRAIDLFRACRDAGEWPGYEPITHLVGPPVWLTYQEDMVI